MLHDKDFINIVRIRRRVFIAVFAMGLVAAVGVSIKLIYFNRLDIPNMQTYDQVLQTFQKATIHSQAGTDTELLLEVADTPEKHATGLMFRQSLAKNSGMVFNFSTDTQNPFWMKNTRIPLDVLFFDAAGRLVDTEAMTPCATDPCPLYFSAFPYRYAVELSAGSVKEFNLQPGDTIAFGPKPKTVL